MDDPLAELPARPSTITVVVWLLLAGALAHLAITIAPDAYRLFGPYLLIDLSMVIGWIRAVAPFLLGAAIILGADQWPAGRRWLLPGAVALGAVGLLALGADIWFALWKASPSVVSDGVQVLLSGRFIAAALAFVAAYALLAAGLWATRHGVSRGGGRRTVMGLIGVGGVVAFVADLWAVSRWLEVTAPPLMMGLYVTSGVLTALGAPAMAALAIAAVRTRPHRGGLPELLIASGAVGAMTGLTWEFVFPSAVPRLDFAAELSVWFFTVPAAVLSLGMIAMISGFGAAALAVRRRTSVGDPTA